MNPVPRPPFPVPDFAWAGSTRVPAGSTYGPYTTAHWEFIWCMEGGARVVSDDAVLELSPGGLQLTPPGVRNHYAWHAASSTTYGYAIFQLSGADPAWPRFRPARPDDIVRPLLDHVLWLDTTQPTDWHSAATTALGYAIRAFVSDASATRVAHDHPLPDAIAEAVVAVRRRWEEVGISQPTVAEMASAAGVTNEYLIRLFTRHVGMGPAATVRTLRLHRAGELLSSTNLGIGEIAALLGFTSEFQFSRSFRTLTGQAPSRFRTDPESRLDLTVELRRLRRQLPM